MGFGVRVTVAKLAKHVRALQFFIEYRPCIKKIFSKMSEF